MTAPRALAAGSPSAGRATATNPPGRRVRPSELMARPIVVRFGESVPLLMAGAGFLSTAWAASAYHLRILGSAYPLWILLAVDGAIILCAGAVGVLLREPSPSPKSDPEFVRVSRTRWESMLRQEQGRDSGVRPKLPARPAPGPIGLDGPARPTGSSVMWATALPAVAPARRSSDVGPPTGEAAHLRLEMGLLELYGIAEAAITTGEKLGGEELPALLEGSAVDLAHLSELLGAPRRRNEAPYALLVRLLRRTQSIPDLPKGRFTAADSERLISRLSAMGPGAANDGRARTPPTELGAAADEFEALLREFAPPRETVKRKTDPSEGTESSVPPKPR
jgi:hypothetical protein